MAESFVPALSLAQQKAELELVGFDGQKRTYAVPEEISQSRFITSYEKIGVIKKGAFSVIYKAVDVASSDTVALKRLNLKKSGEGEISLDFTKEIGILRRLNNDHVIKLRNVATANTHTMVFLAFDYCPFVLSSIISQVRIEVNLSQIKCIMTQLLSGLQYIHKYWAIHRNLNPSHILFNDQGCLKITDFSDARFLLSEAPMTLPSGLLWYQPPEVITYAKPYLCSIDVWSAGCILTELLNRRPLFHGEDDVDMLYSFIGILGTPTEKIWPGCSKVRILRDFNDYVQPYNRLRKSFKDPSSLFLELINKIFLYDPHKRATAKQCLDHPYFKEPPLACSEADITKLFAVVNDPSYDPVEEQRRTAAMFDFVVRKE